MSRAWKHVGPLAMVHACGVGAIALVAGAGWLLVARPSSAREAERELLIRRLADAEPRLMELERTLSETRSRTDDAVRRLDESRGRLGGVENRNQRLTGLTALADECGLRIDRMEPSEVTREGLYLTMAIRMEGEGAYPACARYLHLLLERFSDVNARAFMLEAVPGEAERPARFGFDLVWYADPAGAPRD